MSRISRERAVPLIVCALTLAACGGRVAPVHAADVATLLATAETNTNNVKSLVHRDTTVIKNPTITVSFSATGMEDEQHNREQDHEDVHVHGLDKQKKMHTLNYTADIIFMDGKTYYRVSTVAKNAWQTGTGMKFNDPYTGGWKRGRTTVTFPKNLVFKDAGTSGGQTHVRAIVNTKKVKGTIDLWISTGSTPYVVREQVDQQSKTIKSASSHFTSTLSAFNQPLVIQPPTTSGGST